MAFSPFSARYSPIRVGVTTATNVFTAKKWTVATSITEDEATNFEGSGYYQSKTGILKATVTVEEADWDAQANPFETPLFIIPGYLLKVKLYLNTTSGPYWDFGTTSGCGLTILTATSVADVQKNHKISFTGVNYGTFAAPASIFTPV